MSYVRRVSYIAHVVVIWGKYHLEMDYALFCHKNAFVAIYALFSDNKCPLFTRLGGGGSPKADIVRFFTVFLIGWLP